MHASVGAYIGLFEIFGGGGPVSTPNEANTARKALLLPWGFFIIVTLATYTANLAAVLSCIRDAGYPVQEHPGMCGWPVQLL